MTHDLQGQPLTAEASALRDIDDAGESHDKAIELLVAAVAAGEHDAPELLATCLVERGLHTYARQILQQAVDAGRLDLARFLADEAAELGEAELAERAYRVAITEGDVEALNNYGAFLKDEGRLDEAITILRRAIDAGDDYASAILVSLYAEERGDLDKARQLGERYLDESKPKTFIALADVYGLLGRHDEQENLLDRAIELNAPCAHIEKGSFLRDVRDDVDGAEREFWAARDADQLGWGYELGSLLWETDRVRDAIVVLNHAANWGDADAADLLQEIAAEVGDDWPDFGDADTVDIPGHL